MYRSKRYVISLFLSSLFLAACSNEKSFEILYYSNLNGNIEACECYDVMLGGLHQIKPVVDYMRSQNPHLVFIDGGDTFNSYPFIELDQAVFAAYKLIKPDIWVPGEQELMEGPDFFNSVVSAMPNTFVSSNITINSVAMESQKIYVFRDKKIVISAYTQPHLFEGLDKGPSLEIKSLNVTELAAADYDILVFHGDENTFNKSEELFSAFDLVLTAHLQSPGIDQLGETTVIGGGADGEFLVHIILQENDSGFKISSSKIKIEQKDNPNMLISKIISDYREKIGLDNE